MVSKPQKPHQHHFGGKLHLQHPVTSQKSLLPLMNDVDKVESQVIKRLRHFTVLLKLKCLQKGVQYFIRQLNEKGEMYIVFRIIVSFQLTQSLAQSSLSQTKMGNDGGPGKWSIHQLLVLTFVIKEEKTLTNISLMTILFKECKCIFVLFQT